MGKKTDSRILISLTYRFLCSRGPLKIATYKKTQDKPYRTGYSPGGDEASFERLGVYKRQHLSARPNQHPFPLRQALNQINTHTIPYAPFLGSSHHPRRKLEVVLLRTAGGAVLTRGVCICPKLGLVYSVVSVFASGYRCVPDVVV